MGSTAGGIMGIGGGIMSGIGAKESANALNKAGARSFEQYGGETGASAFMQLLQALGEGAFDQIAAIPQARRGQLFGTPQADIDTAQARMSEIQAQLAQSKKGPKGETKAARDARNAQTRRLKNEYSQLQKQIKAGPTSGMLDLDALKKQYAGKKGWLGEIEDSGKGSIAAGQKLVDQYGKDTTALTNQYKGGTDWLGQMGRQNIARAQSQTGNMVNEAKQFGKGRDEIIQRDYERGLKNANDSSNADMIASGLGASTLTHNARAQNARAFGDARANAQQALADSQIATIMGAKSQGFGAENAARGANLSLMAGRQGGLDTLANQRASGGIALGGQNIDRNLTIQNQAPLMRANLFGSAAFNPFLGQDTTKYNPGLGPTGAMLTSMGNSLSATGGSMAGKGKGG